MRGRKILYAAVAAACALSLICGLHVRAQRRSGPPGRGAVRSAPQGPGTGEEKSAAAEPAHADSIADAGGTACSRMEEGESHAEEGTCSAQSGTGHDVPAQGGPGGGEQEEKEEVSESAETGAEAAEAPEPFRPHETAERAASAISEFLERGDGEGDRMGWFTFSFREGTSEDRAVSDLCEVMRQEKEMFGITVFDIVFLEEKGGRYIFRCYRK